MKKESFAVDRGRAMSIPRLIDIKQVSEMTGLSESALRKRLGRGAWPIKVYKFGSNRQSRIRFSLVEVMKWIEKRRV